MRNEKLSAIIPRLTAEFNDGWEFDDGDLFCLGECCDGIPAWRISPGYGGYRIYSEMGWYEQQGDALDEDDVFRVMHAMEAAEKALNDALSQGRE